MLRLIRRFWSFIAPEEFIFLRPMRKVVAPFFKSDEAAFEGCGGQIKFDKEQVDLPTDHALHGFGAIESQQMVGQEVFIGQVHMDEGEGHGVAAHGPTPVCDIVFIDGRGVSEIGGEEPQDGHRCKAVFGDCAGIVVPSQRNNGYGADDAAEHVSLSHFSMPERFGVAENGNEEKRAGQDREGCGYDMKPEQNITDDRQAFDNNGGEDFVGREQVACDRNVGKRDGQHEYGGNNKTPNQKRDFVDVIESVICLIEEVFNGFHVMATRMRLTGTMIAL